MFLKSKGLRIIGITILASLINIALLYYLYQLGAFNFGFEIIISSTKLLKYLCYFLLYLLIFDGSLIFYVVRNFKHNYQSFGKEYLKLKFKSYKRQLVYGYIFIALIYLLGFLMPVFAYGFVILALLILNPISVLILMSDYYL